MDKQEFLARQPKYPLYGTPQQPRVEDCRPHRMKFAGTQFQETNHSHQILHIARCIDCGLVHKIPRSVKEAGVSGSVDIDDPRVKRTLLLTDSVRKRYFAAKDGRGGTREGMEIFQVPESYGGPR